MINTFHKYECINHPGSMGCLDCTCKNCKKFIRYLYTNSEKYSKKHSNKYSDKNDTIKGSYRCMQ